MSEYTLSRWGWIIELGIPDIGKQDLVWLCNKAQKHFGKLYKKGFLCKERFCAKGDTFSEDKYKYDEITSYPYGYTLEHTLTNPLTGKVFKMAVAFQPFEPEED